MAAFAAVPATTTATTAVSTTAVSTMPAAPTIGLWAAGDIGDCKSDAPAQVANLIQRRPGHFVALGDLACPSGTLGHDLCAF